MKKALKTISGIIVLVLLITLTTGCGIKRKELSFDDGKVLITLNVKDGTDYRISEESEDLRTSREDAILLGDTFKIGIEIKDDLSFSKYSGSFEKYKEEFTDKEEYEEVTYSGINGFVRYYGSYVRYEIYLPVEASDKYIVQLDIYSVEDKKDAAKEQLESEKVKDILNNITITLK